MQADPKGDYAEDVEKAQKALTEAKKKMEALPETNRPIVDFCQKIQNPGASVAKSINTYLTANLGNASNVKSENLPFFANFIESIASNFVSSIIEGQKPSLNILTDAGFKAANLAASSFLENTSDTRKLKNVEKKSNEDSLVFTIEKTEGVANEFKVTWNAEDVSDVVLMQITGPRNYKKNLNDSSGVLEKETLPISGDYVFKAYDNNSQVLASKTTTVKVDATANINLPAAGNINDVQKAIDGTVTPSQGVSHEQIIQDCMKDDKPREQCERENPATPPVSPATPPGGVLGAYISRPTEAIRGWKNPFKQITPRTQME